MFVAEVVKMRKYDLVYWNRRCIGVLSKGKGAGNLSLSLSESQMLSNRLAVLSFLYASRRFSNGR